MASAERASGRIAVDFGRTAEDYGRWRQGFPPEFFERLAAFGVGLAGQRVLDLGTGTGLLARAFALRGCQTTGLDPSAALLAQARRADAEAGVKVGYVEERAEATGLPSGAYDLVSAATCWHWFDRPQAAREARRLLRPDGRLLIAALDWQPLPGNVVDVTLALIDRFNPTKLAHRATFEYPAWTADLTEAGFNFWEVFAFTTTLPYSREAWSGRVRASARVGPAMDEATLRRFDAALTEALEARFPDQPLLVDHRIFSLLAWTADDRS